MKKCSNCGKPLLSEDSRFCSYCGRPYKEPGNHCENAECPRCKTGHIFPLDVMYCDLCGKPTSIGKKVNSMI